MGNFIESVRTKGIDAWNKNNIQNLGSIEDGELLRLYVDAKSKAEEFEKAHVKFIDYVKESADYTFDG